MKSKRLFQILVLLTLLISPFGSNQPARASADLSAPRNIIQNEPSISMSVSPSNVNPGETALVTVSLNNVPAEGYSSAEITCIYNPSLVAANNIVVGDLFGIDPAVAINGPQDGRFIAAIAGSDGREATGGGTVIVFNLQGIQPGQSPLECRARVSWADNKLINIYSIPASLTVLGGTLTPTFQPTACDMAEFIADVNVPPGTVMSPGAQFVKTWRLKNVGSCVWTTSYRLALLSGEQMGAPSSIQFPANVAPGQTVDLSLPMTAPSTAGSYRGYWIFQNATGASFGVGPQGNQPWFVDILVSGATVTPSPSATLSPEADTPTATQTPGGVTATPGPGIVYDFAALACTADWSGGQGLLPCPGIDGDPNGFVIKLNNPRLESGATDTRPGLLTAPRNVHNGYIQGFYPLFHVQNGDRFRSSISCEGIAMDCYVAFRLDYEVVGEPVRTFWGPFLEHYDGLFDSLDIDLSPLAGKDVRFILTVLSVGPASGDRPLWLGPVIYRPDTGPTPTTDGSLTPTFTATPIGDGWWALTNSRYGFEVAYSAHSEVVPGGNDNLTRIDLPIMTGTNLREKYVHVVATENLDPCKSSLPAPQSSETVTYNGVSFLKQTGGTSVAGHTYKWTAYSTPRGPVCVSLDFVLHSIDPRESDVPPMQLYSEAAESVVFAEMAGRFRWLSFPTPTSTSTPIVSATPTFTPTPFNSPTADPQYSGTLIGQVIAGKQVNVSLFDANNRLIVSVEVESDGTYIIAAPAGAGTYTVVATAPGFLSARGYATIMADRTTTMQAIRLLAGDIDNNNLIDQFDALTIGMNYNTALPSAADLNNDGTINVLDLELLARNYRSTGPVAW
jgi:hypothetical protein